MKSILLISKGKDVFNTIHRSVHPEFTVARSTDISSALAILERERFDLLIVEMDLLLDVKPDKGYQEIFEPFLRIFPTLEIVVLSSKKMIREAVEAVRAGARHYLIHPLDPEEIKLIADTAYDCFVKTGFGVNLMTLGLCPCTPFCSREYPLKMETYKNLS